MTNILSWRNNCKNLDMGADTLDTVVQAPRTKDTICIYVDLTPETPDVMHVNGEIVEYCHPSASSSASQGALVPREH